MLARRGFLGGLLALSAPAIIRAPGLLMPVRGWDMGAHPERVAAELIIGPGPSWWIVTEAGSYRLSYDA